MVASPKLPFLRFVAEGRAKSKPITHLKEGSGRALVALLVFVLGLGIVPHRICERDAGAWFSGDAHQAGALAASVAQWTDGELDAKSFATGSERFDHEWLFGTHMMAAMGFGQVVLDHPEDRDVSLARMERCLEAMLDERARSFDTKAWNEDPLASLDGDKGHAAYLGYAGLALGLHRVLRPGSRFAPQHDAIAAALARRIDESPTGFLETYPGEIYPVDNAAAVATIALHARATRRPMPPAVTKALEAMRKHAIDGKSGLLVQAVNADGSRRDVARASGTALAAYFLAYADQAASRTLYRALEKEQFRTVLGFGAVLEYGDDGGRGDIDSGPIALGFGVSATGFALGAARIHDDRETFTALYATAHLFGAPFDENGTRTYTTGGPLGDAILFAMMTAPRPGRLPS